MTEGRKVKENYERMKIKREINTRKKKNKIK
jgi:hypothetical protein